MRPGSSSGATFFVQLEVADWCGICELYRDGVALDLAGSVTIFWSASGFLEEMVNSGLWLTTLAQKQCSGQIYPHQVTLPLSPLHSFSKNL